MSLFEKVGKFDALVRKLDKSAQAPKPAQKPYDLSGLGGPSAAGPKINLTPNDIQSKMNSFSGVLLSGMQDNKNRANILANLGHELDSMFRDQESRTPQNLGLLRKSLDSFSLSPQEKSFLSSKSKLLASLAPGFASTSKQIAPKKAPPASGKAVPVKPTTPSGGMSESDKAFFDKTLSVPGPQVKPASAMPASVKNTLSIAAKLEAKLGQEKKK